MELKGSRTEKTNLMEFLPENHKPVINILIYGEQAKKQGFDRLEICF